MGDQSSDHDYTLNLNTEQNLTEKIKNAVESSHVPVILLNSKNTQVKKFSILANGDHEFVHQFKVDVSNSEYVSCKSGLCQRRFAKKRKLRSLSDTDVTLCRHLTTYKLYLNEQKELESIQR